MSTLKNCLHCGHTAGYSTEDEKIFVRCSNTQTCGMRTPPVAVHADYAAKEKAAAIWNNAAQSSWAQWVQPTGAHDAYPMDAKVSHKGKNWTNLVANNVWEPGVANWRQVT